MGVVGAGVIGVAMVHGMRLSQIPEPLRGLSCERMPAADEASYPPPCWGNQGRIYDVRASIDDVRRHLRVAPPRRAGDDRADARRLHAGGEEVAGLEVVLRLEVNRAELRVADERPDDGALVHD